MRQSRWISAWQRGRFCRSRICDDDENGHDNRKYGRYHDSARLPNRGSSAGGIIQRVRCTGGYNRYTDADYIRGAEIEETVRHSVVHAQ